MKPDIQDPRDGLSNSIRFLSNILDKSTAFTQHIDSQVNILIGLSSLVFAFSATKMTGDNSTVFLILGLFASVSTVISLLAIHPPRSMRKRGQRESLMYNKKINSFDTPAEYKKRLKDVLGNEDAITEQYALEIYNMNKFYYRPKRALYKLARNIFLAGIVFSIVAFLLEGWVRR